MDTLDQSLDQKKIEADQEWHQTQKRKEYDIIRVLNPRQIILRGVTYDLPNRDFYVEYDIGQHQKVEFGATRDISRPKAERYVKHRKDDIINFINQKKHDEFIQERRMKGLPEYKDKATENAETYETVQYPRTDDEALMTEIYDQLWIGITIKSTNDPLPVDPRSGEVDLTPTDTKVLDRLSHRVVDMSSTVSGNSPVESNRYIPQTKPIDTIPPKPSGFADLNSKLSEKDITNE